MRIRIISVGKLKDRWFHEAQAEYIKRLSRFARIDIEEVRDEPAPKNASAGEIEVLMKKEGERIRAAIDKGGGEIIALTPEGRKQDSRGFAEMVKRYGDTGRDITFIIGGSYGISREIKDLAGMQLSFSDLTFPHRLFRIMLLEQIYRAFKINANEEYHK